MRLGLYGLIGSGKTTARNYLKKYYQLEILDLDEISREVIETEEVKTFIMANFPNAYNLTNKEIKRQDLRAIIFNDLQANQTFSNFIWPLIEAKTNDLLSKVPLEQHVIVEGALLPLLHVPLDSFVEIQAPLSLRTKRIQMRDQRPLQETKRVTNIQSNWLKNFTPDVALLNEGSKEDFFKKLEVLMENYKVQKRVSTK